MADWILSGLVSETLSSSDTPADVTVQSDSDWLTHPKWLAEGSGAAVQRVGNGDQCGLCPAACRTVLILILPQRKQQE